MKSKLKEYLGIHKGFTCLCIVPFDLLGPDFTSTIFPRCLEVYMRWIDSCNHDIFACLNIISFQKQKKGNGSFYKTKNLFYEVQISIFIYLFQNRPWINSPFYWGVLTTPQFRASCYTPQVTRQIQGIPIGLTGMTVSYSESVKSDL